LQQCPNWKEIGGSAMKVFDSFQLDPLDQSLWRGGKRVPLAPKAFAVLTYLVDRAGRLVTQTEMLEALWPETFVQPEVLKSQILDIRTALGDRPKEPRFIETVPRRGYRFIASVSESTEMSVPRVVSAEAPKSLEPKKSQRIAVLPFVNMSADPDNEYFSDGLTEELINHLASVPALQVVARTSVFRYKGVNEDIRTIGKQLNVGNVLEGSVRRMGDQLRVTAQLIDVDNGYHLFSRTYQRQFRDVFALQDELAQAVAAEVAPGDGNVPKPAARTENVEAYQAFLRGVHMMSNRFVGAGESLDCFRQALDLDPHYAPAWAGMAQGYFLTAWFYLAPPDEAMKMAHMAALKALDLEPDSALGLAALASVETTEWRWTTAEARFRRALQLQPGLAIAYIQFAFLCLAPQSRVSEACELCEQAASLDPFNPLIQACLIYTYGRSGRLADSERQFRFACNIAPQYAPIHMAMGVSLEWSGNVHQSLPHYRRTAELTQNTPYALSCLGHALAITGDSSEARTCLSALLAFEQPVAADVARVYCGLGEIETALDWLEKGTRQGRLYLLRAIGDPRIDRMSSEPRFQAILRETGLVNTGVWANQASSAATH
jgi:TolB-like protein/tetratricopeptide (TPR) repeat protein